MSVTTQTIDHGCILRIPIHARPPRRRHHGPVHFYASMTGRNVSPTTWLALHADNLEWAQREASMAYGGGDHTIVIAVRVDGAYAEVAWRGNSSESAWTYNARPENGGIR